MKPILWGQRKTQLTFSLKKSNQSCVIQLIQKPDAINQAESKRVLVEAFISEYQQYLHPSEVDAKLNSWREGIHSVQQFYENYFVSEFQEFTSDHLTYWIQATVDGKVVGWATFESEKRDPYSLYMNLLAVDPAYQRQGIGKQLVMALINLGERKNLNKIHLLLRKKNLAGKAFYASLGFNSDPSYQRPDNFVDITLLTPYTWVNPANTNILSKALTQ